MMDGRDEYKELLQRIGMDTPSVASKLRELVKLMDTIGVTDEIVPIDLGVPSSGAAAASGWLTALDVNLFSDDNFTFVDGANSWHDLTVTGMNIASGANIFAVQNGVGLVVDPNATNTDWGLAVNTAPRIEIALSDMIPEYMVGRTPVRAWMQWTAATDADFEQGVWGFAKTPHVNNQTARWTWSKGFQGGLTCRAQVFLVAAAAGSNAPSASDDVGAIVFGDGVLTSFYSKASAAAPSASNDIEFTPDTMNLRFQNRRVGLPTTDTDLLGPVFSAPASLAFTLGAYPLNAANSMSATFTRLRVEYRA